MSIDAMKRAVEALEYAEFYIKSAAEFGYSNRAVAKHIFSEAIADLRAAIEQANEFNPDWDAMAVMVEEQQRMAKRIEELEAQAHHAASQAPMHYYRGDEQGNLTRSDIHVEQAPWVKTYAGGQPNYTTPEEPGVKLDASAPLVVQPHPAFKKWQGLTDDEIAEVRHVYDGTAGWTIERFARQIEAKLKEKNK
jgi:hypothetical protein